MIGAAARPDNDGVPGQRDSPVGQIGPVGRSWLGITASVLAFAAHRLGADTAVYDGSWSEWGGDPATPKATGQA